LTADELVFPQRREGTGQRIVEADLDGVCCARGYDEWTEDLQGACSKPRAEKGAAADAKR